MQVLGEGLKERTADTRFSAGGGGKWVLSELELTQKPCMPASRSLADTSRGSGGLSACGGLLPGDIGELRSKGWKGHSRLSLYPLRASLQAGEASPNAEAS